MLPYVSGGGHGEAGIRVTHIMDETSYCAYVGGILGANPGIMNGSVAQSEGCETIAPYGNMTDNHVIY
jgi:hypothetical protein